MATKKATILPAFPAYGWGDDCTALPLIDTPELSLKKEAMPPGTQERPHYHEHARQYFHIQAGIATFQLPEGLIRVAPGQTIFIPAGLPHCINNQEKVPLQFFVLSLPSTDNDRIVVPTISEQL